MILQAKNKLPKNLRGGTGYIKYTPVLDENGVVIRLSGERKGIDSKLSLQKFSNNLSKHIKDFDKWYNSIPNGKLVILQSNNYFDLPEHVNCVENEVQLAITAPMSDVLYMGSLKLEKYSRFMVIGYK